MLNFYGFKGMASYQSLYIPSYSLVLGMVARAVYLARKIFTGINPTTIFDCSIRVL